MRSRCPSVSKRTASLELLRATPVACSPSPTPDFLLARHRASSETALFGSPTAPAQHSASVFVASRPFKSWGGPAMKRLPQSLKETLMDVGVCHYMVGPRHLHPEQSDFDLDNSGPPRSARPSTPCYTAGAGHHLHTLHARVKPISHVLVKFPDGTVRQWDFGPCGGTDVHVAVPGMGLMMGRGTKAATAAAAVAAASQAQEQTASLQMSGGGGLANGGGAGGSVAWEFAAAAAHAQEQEHCDPGVPGEIREDVLPELPRHSPVMHVGSTMLTPQQIRYFNQRQPKYYLLHENDCRHFANNLVQHMTGMQRSTAVFLKQQYVAKANSAPHRHPHRPIIEALQAVTDVTNWATLKRATSVAAQALASLVGGAKSRGGVRQSVARMTVGWDASRRFAHAIRLKASGTVMASASLPSTSASAPSAATTTSDSQATPTTAAAADGAAPGISESERGSVKLPWHQRPQLDCEPDASCLSNHGASPLLPVEWGRLAGTLTANAGGGGGGRGGSLGLGLGLAKSASAPDLTSASSSQQQQHHLDVMHLLEQQLRGAPWQGYSDAPHQRPRPGGSSSFGNHFRQGKAAPASSAFGSLPLLLRSASATELAAACGNATPPLAAGPLVLRARSRAQQQQHQQQATALHDGFDGSASAAALSASAAFAAVGPRASSLVQPAAAAPPLLVARPHVKGRAVAAAVHRGSTANARFLARGGAGALLLGKALALAGAVPATATGTATATTASRHGRALVGEGGSGSSRGGGGGRSGMLHGRAAVSAAFGAALQVQHQPARYL